MKLLFVLGLLLCLFQSPLFAQTDTLVATEQIRPGTTPHQYDPAKEEDFNLFLLVFAMVAVSLMIGIAIAGFLAILVSLLAISAFIGAGVLSASLLTALYKKSVTSGFRVFIYAMGIFAGLGMGGLAFAALSLATVRLSPGYLLMACLTGGLLGGLLLAFLINRLSGMILRTLQRKTKQGSFRTN